MRGIGERYFSAPAMRYLEESKIVQEQLHQVLTQMSGFALLLLTDSARPSLCAGPLQLAGERMDMASEQFRGLKPVGDEARHHHHHLAQATRAVQLCVAIAYDCLRTGAADGDRDRLTRMLRRALEHLKMTARLLPGFSMVDLTQSCCAAHLAAENAELALTIA